MGTLGRAFLFSKVYPKLKFNRDSIYCGPSKNKLMLTGFHTTQDVFCKNCSLLLGWKYVIRMKLLTDVCGGVETKIQRRKSSNRRKPTYETSIAKLINNVSKVAN